jgi:hypothetical protein
VNASKEEAKKALTIAEGLPGDNGQLIEFLKVVVKRLPTEKAIAQDKERKKQERKAARQAK